MVTFTINIPPKLAYMPYMDPMGYIKKNTLYRNVYVFFHVIFWGFPKSQQIPLDFFLQILAPLSSLHRVASRTQPLGQEPTSLPAAVFSAQLDKSELVHGEFLDSHGNNRCWPIPPQKYIYIDLWYLFMFMYEFDEITGYERIWWVYIYIHRSRRVLPRH
jgi:hypothetical protein